jgi:phospholipase C
MKAMELAKAGCAATMAAILAMQPLASAAQNRSAEKVVELGPPSSPLVSHFTSEFTRQQPLSEADKLALLKKKIKYLFVLFQENRSFDFYFGTYPGARGLFSQPVSRTPGFVQPIVDTNGKVISISPFLIPQTIANTAGQTVQLYPQDIDSVNHGHTAMDAKLDLDASKLARNDRYAFVEEGLTGKLSADGKTYVGPNPTLAQKQMGELVVSHVDCGTAPFLWSYADRFTLFDNFFDTVIGPSTPNALAMFSGQSGVTEWVEHPSLGSNVTTTNAQLPMTGDPQPFWGSALNTLAQTPTGNFEPTAKGGARATAPASNLTYASLGLSFMGNQIKATTAQDLDPAFDLADVQDDIAKIAGDHNKPVNWAWYQEGYDQEPTDPPIGATHKNYIAHHDAPQYFGYEANNPAEIKAHLKGLGDFYAAIKANALPEEGGVFYVRGGYGNLDGMKPLSPSPSTQANFPGNDDHPGYSDAQISEAMLADSINAIATSKYWPESAIIITYDETDGLYDHTQPSIRSWDPSNGALEQGPRIPMILISPYAKVHAISHEPTEHGSIIKFIDKLFNLTPLAELPDEAAAQQKGLATYGQKYLEPSDGADTPIGWLFSAFDDDRLRGKAAPLPFWYAMIPQRAVKSMPHLAGRGCHVLRITPTDIVNGRVVDPAPADFNPRPSTNPGLPTTPGWPTN